MANLLLFAYECDPYRGSEYSRSWQWAIQYAKAGYKTWCITSLRGKEGIERKLEDSPVANLHFIYVELSPFIEKKYGKGLFWVYLHYFLWLRKAGKQAIALHNKYRFDFAHHVSWGSIQQGTSIYKLNIPFVFGPVGGGQFAPKVLKKYFLSGWRTEVLRAYISQLFLLFNHDTRTALKKAQLVLVVNDDTRKLAEKFGARKVVHFTDLNLDKLLIQKEINFNKCSGKIKLLWVGRLLYRKGLPLILETLSKIPDSYNFELSIYGDGPFGKELPAMVESFGLTTKVKWYGQVPFSDLKNAYLNHDVFFFCSLRESLGLQYFEAMSYGLPIITLNIHGVKNTISDKSALKIEVYNRQQVIDELLNAVIYLIDHPEMRQVMAKNALDETLKISELDKISFIEREMGFHLQK